jgi:hypothetical protein
VSAHFVGQRRLAGVVLDGAIAYCEENHAVSPLMAVLMNRAFGTVTYDIREALHLYERAFDHIRQANDYWGVLLTTQALHMARTIAGRWDDEVAEETDWLVEPLLDEIPLFRRVRDALAVVRAWIRGQEPAVPDEPLDDEALSRARTDMAQEVAVVRLVLARAHGGLADLAVELGRIALTGLGVYGGTTEWYPFLWSCAVGWLIDSGTADDLAAARRALADVEAAGRVDPALAAQLPRLRATLAIREGGPGLDGDAVERDLREAIDLLEDYGAAPDRARAQEELGRWLTAAGRGEEGAALLATALATMTELGMPPGATGGRPLARIA